MDAEQHLNTLKKMLKYTKLFAEFDGKDTSKEKDVQALEYAIKHIEESLT